MNIRIPCYIPGNMLEEGKEFLVVVAALALRQLFPGGAIQGGKQRCGAVTKVSWVSPSTWPSPTAASVGPRQCLDLSLLRLCRARRHIRRPQV